MLLALQNSYIVLYCTRAIMPWCIKIHHSRYQSSAALLQRKLCSRFIREITHWKQTVMKAVFFLIERAFLQAYADGKRQCLQVCSVLFHSSVHVIPDQYLPKQTSVHGRNRLSTLTSFPKNKPEGLLFPACANFFGI